MPINSDMARRSAIDAVAQLLQALGEDISREGLLETPRRLVDALTELTTPRPFNFTTFEAEGMSEMIVQTHIPIHSLCEHHMLPFFGTAVVAYVPDKRIVGLSKLTRTVKFCAAGLQNQERITRAVADMLEKNLKPLGVGVVIKARHLCMEVRGACAPGVLTTTSDLRGVLQSEADARAEFMTLARG